MSSPITLNNQGPLFSLLNFIAILSHLFYRLNWTFRELGHLNETAGFDSQVDPLVKKVDSQKETTGEPEAHDSYNIKLILFYMQIGI